MTHIPENNNINTQYINKLTVYSCALQILFAPGRSMSPSLLVHRRRLLIPHTNDTSATPAWSPTDVTPSP